MLSKITFLILSGYMLHITAAFGHENNLRSVVEEIRFEATLENTSQLGKPLPLVAHWNTGELKGGYGPDYQMELIEKGYYILPWFHLPPPNKKFGIKYYERALRKAARLKLPVSFVSTQWERLLSDMPEYLNLPASANPNVLTVEGKILPKVSPFGGLAPWYEVGRIWTTTPLLKKLQKWYPDPPLVLFLSNNEHLKLRWTEANTSERYLKVYGNKRDNNFTRKVFGDGWIDRYRILFKGMREGLESPSWRENARFAGYNAFGPAHLGRWSRWRDYSLYTPGQIDPYPFAWDGASVSYYTNNWNASTDYTVFSPQIESMNWYFMLEEVYRNKPGYWFEMSVWDGYQPSMADDKRKFYASQNQVFGPERYAGMVKYGMWILRPRVIREFRNPNQTVGENEPYFISLLEAVGEIHRGPVLRKFWRRGELVSNNEAPHPYQEKIPEEYASVERYFLLQANKNPKRPWKLDTRLRVFSLALVLGERPSREWLVYAHSPLEEMVEAKINLPGYGPIQIRVTSSGAYYHVVESAGVVEKIGAASSGNR